MGHFCDSINNNKNINFFTNRKIRREKTIQFTKYLHFNKVTESAVERPQLFMCFGHRVHIQSMLCKVILCVYESCRLMAGKRAHTHSFAHTIECHIIDCYHLIFVCLSFFVQSNLNYNILNNDVILFLVHAV